MRVEVPAQTKMKVVRAVLFLLLRLELILADVSNLSHNGLNEDENGRFIKEEAYDQNSDSRFTDNIPGDPQRDYPTYEEIPRTGFSCRGKVNWHYYADIDTGCQTFHMCQSDYAKISFLCPVGSVFNQRHLVCDWWYNVDCNDAENFYPLNEAAPLEYGESVDRKGFDLNQASSESEAKNEKGRLKN